MPNRRRTGPGHRPSRGRTLIWERSRAAPSLKKLPDQGGEAELSYDEVGGPDRPDWIDSFLTANRDALARLAIATSVRVKEGRALVVLTSSDRLGAIPIRSPITRKITGGLLVEPRFGWSSIGQVLGEVGFRVEPEIGGLALVPGSAREVPPWVLAGPLVSRVAALIAQMTRTFVPTTLEREMPRGTVDWNCYAGRALPTGRWTSFQCSYSELSSDPELVAALRWTLRRVGEDLEPAADFLVARRLMERIGDLLRALGPGPARRPGLSGLVAPSIAPEWLRLAVEAMAWVRDERGLGGARSLDGLPWSLPVNSLWEAWVEAFLHSLAQRLGGRLSTGREGSTSRPFVWRTRTRSMGHLAPDFLLELPGRAVWIDAKYKDHLRRLAVQDWSGLPVALRESHRADLHQALAYAMFAEAPRVDTFLVYPGTVGPAGEPVAPEPVFALADLVAGGRQVRLGLGSIPFGFQGPAHREQVVAAWEKVLRDAA
jgi:hypothetical protein